jgi:hypothetical protein
MPTVRTPAGTRIFMQDTIGAAQSITGITKANPAVITYDGADSFTNASYAALTDMYGMTEFEDALIKVANVVTGSNTLEAEDQSSVGYGTFVDGKITPVTLATEITVASGFSISGGEQQFAEYQYLWDQVARRFPTVTSGVSLDLQTIWDPQDASMIAIRQAADTKAKRAFKVAFPDGLEMLFYGYVGAPGLPAAQDMNSVMQTSVSIVLATKPRYIFP